MHRDEAGAVAVTAPTSRWIRRGLLELALLSTLYVVYSASRLLASDALAPARERAERLLDVERTFGIAWETTLNHWFVVETAVGIVGSYWYATTHYVVTAGALIWLYRRGPAAYLPARRALVIATVVALVAYLLVPTAPPRLIGGYTDVLSLTSADGWGWWSGAASAPKGLGGLTNQLAAFPSLHAGWALWVAIVLHQHAPWRGARIAGWGYALVTALVIVGTGNHWVIDVLTGWLVIAFGFAAVRSWQAGRGPDAPSADPSSATSAAGSP